MTVQFPCHTLAVAAACERINGLGVQQPPLFIYQATVLEQEYVLISWDNPAFPGGMRSVIANPQEKWVTVKGFLGIK